MDVLHADKKRTSFPTWNKTKFIIHLSNPHLLGALSIVSRHRTFCPESLLKRSSKQTGTFRCCGFAEMSLGKNDVVKQ